MSFCVRKRRASPLGKTWEDAPCFLNTACDQELQIKKPKFSLVDDVFSLNTHEVMHSDMLNGVTLDDSRFALHQTCRTKSMKEPLQASVRNNGHMAPLVKSVSGCPRCRAGEPGHMKHVLSNACGRLQQASVNYDLPSAPGAVSGHDAQLSQMD